MMVLLRLLAFVPTKATASTLPAQPSSAPTRALAATPRPTSSSAQPIPQRIAPTAAMPSFQAPAVKAQVVHAVPQAPASSGEIRSFDGDWPLLAKRVKLLGFAQQFMQQSQLVSTEPLDPVGYVFKVRVPLKILADLTNVNKVKDALTLYFGQPVRVVAEVGTVEAGTAAHVVAEQKAQAQEQAESSIADDLFVQGLQKEFGATIVPGSVAPNGSSGNS
jgi:DNA polymerase III subunit gamma/tau